MGEAASLCCCSRCFWHSELSAEPGPLGTHLVGSPCGDQHGLSGGLQQGPAAHTPLLPQAPPKPCIQVAASWGARLQVARPSRTHLKEEKGE